MRRSSTLLIAAAMLLASASPVLAAKPEHGKLEMPDPVELPAGEICDFPVTLDNTTFRSSFRLWENEDGSVRYVESGYAGGFAENADGDRVTHSGGYRLTVLIDADGATEVSVSGVFFAWYLEGDNVIGLSAPGAFAVHGRGSESYAADGSLIEARLHGGRVVDLCEALAPAT